MLEASLEDLQGRFNLNNLVNEDGTPDTTQVNAFVQLLAMLGLEPKWAGYLIDWIDVDIVPAEPRWRRGQRVHGADAARIALPTATSPVRRELLALPGFGRDRYLKLAPYVAALPQGTAHQHLHRLRGRCSMPSSARGTASSAPTRSS